MILFFTLAPEFCCLINLKCNNLFKNEKIFYFFCCFGGNNGCICLDAWSYALCR